jgi:hypothetical protein
LPIIQIDTEGAGKNPKTLIIRDTRKLIEDDSLNLSLSFYGVRDNHNKVNLLELQVKL